MNYIDLINHFWRVDEGSQFTGWETKLYFYLIKTANSLGWVNVFWHSDSRVSANVGMSINTMKTSRNRLKQVGLIEFHTGGKGKGDKTRYQILLPNATSLSVEKPTNKSLRSQKLTANLTPNDAPELEIELEEDDGCQNLPPKLTPKLTPKLIPKVTPNPQPLYKLNETKLKEENNNNTLLVSENDLPEKNEAEAATLVYVDAQRQQAAMHADSIFTKEDLKADLLESEICKMSAKNNEVLPEEYPVAVENFVETKFGLGKNAHWKDITYARENFMYWLPYYKTNIAKKHGKRNTPKTTGRQIVEQQTNDDSVVEQGADGVVRRVSGTGVQTFAG